MRATLYQVIILGESFKSTVLSDHVSEEAANIIAVRSHGYVESTLQKLSPSHEQTLIKQDADLLFSDLKEKTKSEVGLKLHNSSLWKNVQQKMRTR